MNYIAYHLYLIPLKRSVLERYSTQRVEDGAVKILSDKWCNTYSDSRYES